MYPSYNLGPDIFNAGGIKVEGTEGEIIFDDLRVHQAVAEVNSFSFIWYDDGAKPTIDTYVKFYEKNLSKGVSIALSETYTFKGFITGIHCIQGDELGIQYEIRGKGLMAKLDEVQECNSFTKKTIKAIFTELNTAGVPLNLAPKTSGQLFYTVQYNQTAFAFYRMMAMRHGEWFYYNGKEMVLGEPTWAAASLQIGLNVDNLVFSAEIKKGTVQSNGFDQRKGEMLKKKTAAPPPSFAKLIAASMKAGEDIFSNNVNGMSMPHVTTPQVLDSVNELHQQGKAAAAVHISGHSYASHLYAGMRINIKDNMDGDAGDYIITEIHHSVNRDRGYENKFKACPAEVEVPPYTNPMLFPQCKPQPALVTHNADTDGLDRIKVRFPWQKASETSPWINVLTPHAGKDKGFRFLPEVDEEVMVGFIDDNAEKPFFMGAIHTEKNKSADAEVGNNLKAIGTVSGRRLEINDEKGLLIIADNRTGQQPRNVLAFERNDSKQLVQLSSGKSDQNFSAVQLTNEELAGVVLFSGGQIIAEVKLTKAGQKITIHAKGSIEINADQEISLNAPNIKINATQKLTMEGKMGVAMKGMKMELEADTNMDVKGLETKIEGTAKLDLSAMGIATIVGALVKIN